MYQNNLDIICRYILQLNPKISHIALQKLLYFIQAYILVATNGREVAFKEDIEAWMYGPTIKVVAMNYKKDKNYYRKEVSQEELDSLSSIIKESIEGVIESLGNLSIYTLINLTHSYPTWQNAWDSLEVNAIITKEEMYKFHSRKNKEEGNMI